MDQTTLGRMSTLPSSSRPLTTENSDNSCGGKWKKHETSARNIPTEPYTLEGRQFGHSTSEHVSTLPDRNRTYQDLRSFLSTHDGADFWSSMEQKQPVLFSSVKRLTSIARSKKGSEYQEVRKQLREIFANKLSQWDQCPYLHSRADKTIKVTASHEQASPQTPPLAQPQLLIEHRETISFSSLPISAPIELYHLSDSTDERAPGDLTKLTAVTTVRAIEKQTKKLLGSEAVTDLSSPDTPNSQWVNKDDWDKLADFEQLLKDRPLDNPKELDSLKQWLKLQKHIFLNGVQKSNLTTIFNLLCIQYISIKFGDGNFMTQPMSYMPESKAIVRLQKLLTERPQISLKALKSVDEGLFYAIAGLILKTQDEPDFSTTDLAKDLDEVTQHASWSWRDLVVDESHKIDKKDNKPAQWVYVQP